jgi:hypothetical protein
MPSVLTYRFDVHVRAQVFLDGSEGTFMSFVSVGETANLTPGQDVVAGTGAGWPLIHDLSEPTLEHGSAYKGPYGYTVGGPDGAAVLPGAGRPDLVVGPPDCGRERASAQR